MLGQVLLVLVLRVVEGGCRVVDLGRDVAIARRMQALLESVSAGHRRRVLRHLLASAPIAIAAMAALSATPTLAQDTPVIVLDVPTPASSPAPMATPAMPAMPDPRPKVSMLMRSGLMPMLAAMLGFCVTARTSRPNRVRFISQMKKVRNAKASTKIAMRI